MSKRKVAAPPPQRRPAHAPHQRRHLPGQQVAAHALEQADALLLVLGVDHRVGQVLQQQGRQRLPPVRCGAARRRQTEAALAAERQIGGAP